MLALKKLDADSDNALVDLPSQFKLRFKFYNFDWAESEHLIFDPLAPINSPLVPIFTQKKIRHQNPSLFMSTYIQTGW